MLLKKLVFVITVVALIPACGFILGIPDLKSEIRPSGPMPLISRNVPAFVPSGSAGESNANDDDYNTMTYIVPSSERYLAYDLSGVPVQLSGQCRGQ